MLSKKMFKKISCKNCYYLVSCKNFMKRKHYACSEYRTKKKMKTDYKITKKCIKCNKQLRKNSPHHFLCEECWVKKQLKNRTAYLAPDVILSMLLYNDKGHIERLLNTEGITLMVSDFGLYEAIGCLTLRDMINLRGLQELLLKAQFITSPIKLELSTERKKRLREIAIKKN